MRDHAGDFGLTLGRRQRQESALSDARAASDRSKKCAQHC